MARFRHRSLLPSWPVLNPNQTSVVVLRFLCATIASHLKADVRAVRFAMPLEKSILKARASVRIFVRAEYPDERLDVNHVARAQIFDRAPHSIAECQKARISRPPWLRMVGKRKGESMCRPARDIRL